MWSKIVAALSVLRVILRTIDPTFREVLALAAREVRARDLQDAPGETKRLQALAALKTATSNRGLAVSDWLLNLALEVAVAAVKAGLAKLLGMPAPTVRMGGALLLLVLAATSAGAACIGPNTTCVPARGDVCCAGNACLGSDRQPLPPTSTKGGACKPWAGTTPTTVPPSTTVPTPTTTPTTRPPTTTVPPPPSTTLPPVTEPAGYEPDTWRPDYVDVSLGSTPKHIHPTRGDYCDQRCLFLRIETRAFDAWPMVIRYLRDLGLAADVKRQVNPSAGLPMVASEVGIENSGRELNQGKAWNFGPDYDWNGNVSGNLTRACEAIINASRRGPITVPADVQVVCDITQEPQQPARKGNAVVTARAAAALSVPTTDVAIKLRGLVSAKVGCRQLTQAQLDALALTMSVHAENSAYRKRTGQGRPGGAAALMAAHAALEALARDADELTLFTIPAFAQTLDPTYPKAIVDQLMDLEDAAHHAWAAAVRLCYTSPRIFRARAWSLGNEHTRGHLFAALNAGMALRVSVDAPLVALGDTPPCTDRTLDKCPNLPFPPNVQAGRDAGLGVIEGGR